MLLRPDHDPRLGFPVEWLVDATGSTWQLGSTGYLATLFVPLDEPVLVERGFVRAWQERLEPFDDGYHVGLVPDIEFVARKRISMCVIRVERDLHSEREQLVQEAVRASFPAIPTPSSVPYVPVAASVVEVTGPVRSKRESDLSDFVDEAIHGVRRMQQAYGSATGKSPRLVTRHAMPPSAPIFVRSPDTDVATVHPDGVLMMMNSNIPVLKDVAEDLPADVVAKMDGLVRQIEGETPFVTSGLRLGEALRWIEVEGEPWPGIALLGTACEVMFDELLCAVLWESDSRPEDCSKFLVGAITRRIEHGPLREMLPGDWDLRGDGPIADWNRDVARLRNEAMHLGRPPDHEQITQACASALALRDELQLRITIAIETFPRTAWMLMGNNQMPEPLRLEHVEPLLDLAAEVDWKTAASAWRRAAVYNTKFGRWSDRKANREDLELLAVAHPDGEIHFVVADKSCERAFRLSGPPEWLSKEQLKTIDDLVSRVDASRPVVSIVLETTGPLPTCGDWVAWYRLLPNHEVLVSGPALDHGANPPTSD